MFEGRNEGLSFDQLWARYPDELAAWDDWKTRLEQRAGAPRKRVPRKASAADA